MKRYDDIPIFDLRLLDLEVQTPSAKLNANTSTSSGLTAGMVTFYDKNLIKLAQAAADGGKALKIRILSVLVEDLQLQLIVVPLLAQLRQPGKLLAPQVYIGTGFVQ